MYIPLFNVTNYTLLSSLLKIDDLIDYTKNNNISTISITDTNMFGTMEFIKKCEKWYCFFDLCQQFIVTLWCWIIFLKTSIYECICRVFHEHAGAKRIDRLYPLLP